MTPNPAPHPLTDTTKFLRDPFSKGLLSVDTAGQDAYRARRRSAEQLRQLGDDINTVRTELQQMKELLLSIVQHGRANV